MTNLKAHLKARELYIEKYTTVYLDESKNMATFLLHNLSGEMVGYQTYKPDAPKVRGNKDPQTQKYWNYVSPEGKKRKLAVWGLETVKNEDRVLYLVEGVFDACKLHNLGLPCIATLCNDPKHLRNWLYTLNKKIVAFCDGDSAGDKLKNTAHEYVTLPDGKDLGDMTMNEVKKLVERK